jgi:SAM-dependent methyltransferase
MKITPYELARRSVELFLPPLYSKVRAQLIKETKDRTAEVSILDVGGRKSPYTIGVPARITIIDLPRSTEIQNQLRLGINADIERDLKVRRSNIDRVILGDMTRSGLPKGSFDLIVSVEVLEHVVEDEMFVSEVSRVLKPGGRFIMTTPNGDYVENKNPDHKRHYKKQQLQTLLKRYFEEVEIEYAIAGGYYRKLGLRSWSVRKPARTFMSALGNVVNSIQSAQPRISDAAVGTHHLFAIARKQAASSQLQD